MLKIWKFVKSIPVITENLAIGNKKAYKHYLQDVFYIIITMKNNDVVCFK